MLKFIDLFCGIGAFHFALQDHQCVLACDNNKTCRDTYMHNYGLKSDVVKGDIRLIQEIPKADLVCAGFPCQSFSIIGNHKGLRDSRGLLIYEVFRVIQKANPNFVILENVKNLLKSEGTLQVITETMTQGGFDMYVKVLNAKDHGIPQNRERVFIVCVKKGKSKLPFEFPAPVVTPSLSQYLKQDLLKPYSYCIRAFGGRYAPVESRHNWSHYRTADGRVYKLTLGDCTRLMGFPMDFVLCGSTKRKYEMLGNSIPTCLTTAVVSALLCCIENGNRGSVPMKKPAPI